MEKSDEFVKTMFGYDYVHFMDQIPEIKQFMQELAVKEKEREDMEKEASNKVVDYN
jgi:hypothetical protein